MNTIVAFLVFTIFTASFPCMALGDQTGIYLPLSALGKKEKMIEKVIPLAEFEQVGVLNFSRDGRSLATANRVSDVSTGKLTGSMNSPFVAATGDWLRAAYHDTYAEKIVLLDTVAKAVIKELSIPASSLNAAEFSRNGSILATSGGIYKDLFVIIWDGKTGDKIKRLEDYKINQFDFSPDGSILAGAGQLLIDGKTILWDTSTWEEIRQLPSSSYVKSVRFSPDGKTLATGDWDNKVVLWDVATGKEIRRFNCPGYVESIAFSPDGKVIASGGYEKSVILWDVETGRKIKALEGHKNPVRLVAFSPDGSILVSADDHSIIFWSDNSPEEALTEISRSQRMMQDPSDDAARDILAERDRKIEELKSPRGEFETTREYQVRVNAAKAEEARLRGEYGEKAEQAREKRREEVARENEKYRKDFDQKKAVLFPVELTPVLDRYDADRGGYPASIGGESVFIPVPREKAVQLSKGGHELVVTGMARYYDPRRAELVDSSLWDRTTDWRFPFGAAAAATSVNMPPELAIVGLSLAEPSGDGILDAGESGLVKVSVKNTGKGGAFGVTLGIKPDNQPGSLTAGFSIADTTFIGAIQPGEEKSLEIPVEALEELKSGEVRLKATLVEANGFDSRPVVLAMKTRESYPPRLEVARVDILDSDDHRVISRGKECRIAIFVRNSGSGPARGVSVGLSSASTDIKIFGDSVNALGALSPGETKKAVFNIAVTQRYAGPASLPMAFTIQEERERYAVKPEVRLALNEEAPEFKVVRVQAKETSALPESAGPEDVPAFAESARLLGANDFAVVIGIEQYQNVPRSDYSLADAKLVRAYLKALGLPERNIEFLANDRATLSAMVKSLERWLGNRVKKGSRVFIYYSGHGAPDPVTGRGYLVPFDGDPNYLADMALPLDRLYKSLGRLPASEVLVILDACFSGTGGRSVIAKGARPLVMIPKTGALPPNVAVLAATEGAQISTSSPEKGHGVLTYYLLNGIREGKKDVADLFGYLRNRVEDEAKTLNVMQTPNLVPEPERLKGKFRFLR